MIQIGRLRKWIQKDGTESPKAVFKPVNNFVYKTLKGLFTNIESDIDKFLPKEEQHNLFYTVAHHTKDERSKKAWQCQDIIPFDLDGIDLNRIDEYAPIVAEVCDFDLSKTAIVYSGNGVHILINVPRITNKDGYEFVRDSKLGYRQLLERVKEACTERDLPFDIDTTALDYARILRCPFTKNIKLKKQPDGSIKEVTKECKLIQNNLEVQEWGIPKIERVPDKLSLKSGSFPLPDKNEVLKECLFFKWLDNNPDEVHEPHAYAMLSIAGHFADDNKTAKNLYSKFSSPSVLTKPFDEFLEQALATSGPRTCKGIDDIWNKCDQCKHYTKLTSPILLKGPDHIGTEFRGFTTPMYTVAGVLKGLKRHYSDIAKYIIREKHLATIPTKKVDMHIFNGKYYDEYTDAEAKSYVQDLFKPTVEDDRVRIQAIQQVKASSKILKPVDFFHSGNNGLLNLKNGVYNFDTKELEPHNPKYGFTTCVDYDYNPDATCPTWDKFVFAAMKGDTELTSIIEEIMAFALSGMSYSKIQFYFLFVGTGFNGKSVMLNLLAEMLGTNNVCANPLEDLIKDEKCRADLATNLANIVPDSSARALKGKDLTRLKSWTGNDTVNGRQIYKEGITFTNKCKFIFGFNDKPEIKSKTKGDDRRIKTIPFKADFDGDDKHLYIKDLPEKLTAELPGILNRVIQGYERLIKKGTFTTSVKVELERYEMKKHADPVFDFYTDCIVYSEGSTVSCEDMLEYFNKNKEYSTDGFEKKQRSFTKEIGNLTRMNTVDKRIVFKKIKFNGVGKRGLCNATVKKEDIDAPPY